MSEMCQPTTGSISVVLTACDPFLGEPACPDRRSDASVHCDWMWQLHLAFKDCVVTHAGFHHMRPGLLEYFTPLSARWQHSTVYAHLERFATSEHLTQFFGSLAVTTRTLNIDLCRQPRFLFKAKHFWDLNAIKRCEHLHIQNLSWETKVTGVQVLAWLKIPHDHATTKTITLDRTVLKIGKRELINTITSDFTAASSRCSFTVEIECFEWDGLSGYLPAHRLTNTDTSEELLFTIVENRTIVVVRKAI